MSRPFVKRKAANRVTFTVALPLDVEKLIVRAANELKMSRNAWIAARLDQAARHQLAVAKEPSSAGVA